MAQTFWGGSEMSELDDLKKRVEELEKAANPPEPFNPGPRFQFDPTAGFSMPRSAMKAMIDAVPEALMSELRMDARKPNPVNPPSPPQPQVRQRATPNWIEERPLESPPGIKIIDAMMDAQDERDKAERTLALMKAGMLKKE
jgi:hypothetical protein